MLATKLFSKKIDGFIVIFHKNQNIKTLKMAKMFSRG